MPPPGWCCAQCLVPLGQSDSDDDDGPCTLPDDRVVCAPRGLVICHKCCQDFNFMDNYDDEDGDDDEDSDDRDVEDRVFKLVFKRLETVMASVTLLVKITGNFPTERIHKKMMDAKLEISLRDLFALSPGVKSRFLSKLEHWDDAPENTGEKTEKTHSSAAKMTTDHPCNSTTARPNTSAGGPEVSNKQPPKQPGSASSAAPHSTKMPDINFSNTGSLPDHIPMRRGTGRVFPEKFHPPSDSITPQELFKGRRFWMEVQRHTLVNDDRTGIIYTDGACPNNGKSKPQASWAFWHGSGRTNAPLTASGRLEKKGPFGDDVPQTSNRAELRAVIAALRFRYWAGERFHTIVIATDSGYTVEGITDWVKTWVQNKWKTSNRTEVKNRDLWEVLLGEIERYHDNGMAVKFWRIPREWNVVADRAAKLAAKEEEVPEEYMEVNGLCFEM